MKKTKRSKHVYVVWAVEYVTGEIGAMEVFSGLRKARAGQKRIKKEMYGYGDWQVNVERKKIDQVRK